MLIDSQSSLFGFCGKILLVILLPLFFLCGQPNLWSSALLVVGRASNFLEFGQPLAARLRHMSYYDACHGDLSRCLIVSMGRDTQHWAAVQREYPRVLNCTINVCRAFAKDDRDVVRSTGFDVETRNRMKAKDGWNFVWNVAMCILREFGFLVVLCNHGKHRSLSLAIELSKHLNCGYRCIRDQSNPWVMRPVRDVMDELRPALSSHVNSYGAQTFPIRGVRVCTTAFDGPAYINKTDPDWGTARCRYLQLVPGHLLLEVHRTATEAVGWSYGFPVSSDGSVACGWYPPDHVDQNLGDQHERIMRLFSDLRRIWR